MLAAGVPVLILAVVFPLDWLTGAVFLFTAPLIPLFMILIGRMAERVTRRQWRALQRLNDYVLDTIQGLVSLKAMGRTREREARLGGWVMPIMPRPCRSYGLRFFLPWRWN